MVAITLLGRTFDVAPYKLGQMIEAAPILDAQQARNRAVSERLGITFLPSDTTEDVQAKAFQITASMTTAETLLEAADAVRVLHIGISKIDPSVTVQQLLDDVDVTPEGIGAVVSAMMAVLGHSGLTSGEATAPAPVADAAGA